MSDVPESHPRYESLRLRDRLVAGVEAGITSAHGLIAHGRGEAYDYLLGETGGPWATTATEATAAWLLRASHPVLSVNGNTASLVPEDLVRLSTATGAPLEVNIFHTSSDRERAMAEHLKAHGATDVLLPDGVTAIEGIDSNRRFVHSDGILQADVIFVPLEDGDRCGALRRLGRDVLTVDLNPLSRTARTATVTIVDNVVRALPALLDQVERLRDQGEAALDGIIRDFDNTSVLAQAEQRIRTGGR
ncbi:MAG TPA: phosphopantothenate/pantothenate synthetase [Candidatus Latescibacteria bacterium]|jgi:4-phosphopantoate--beta-alanine ligase|nr:phosphopantothenate/pantothenate synthetase [Gemmatimonadaceae bacterium]MDP6016833.1 phosphopantothenate/pantothenate synthetase [Candidatus Latescibacterota bacterium]HJP32246.1 phosphopantothenate/pantothenate synthetase [Candidatus Latescibacterota bacterium]